jgi:hypothetical protein
MYERMHLHPVGPVPKPAGVSMEVSKAGQLMLLRMWVRRWLLMVLDGRWQQG